MKPASNKSLFSQPCSRIECFGHIFERNTFAPLKSIKDATLKLQTVSNEKNLQEFFFMDKLL